ncbi:hypothetical protein ACLMJK_006467 [Lecanora helva]
MSISRLDRMFSEIFKFKFEPSNESQRIVEQAAQLLERLPAIPLELPEIPVKVTLAYSASSVAFTGSSKNRLWGQLQATTFVASNVLRAALSAAIEPKCQLDLLDMTDIIAFLLEIVSQRSQKTANDAETWRAFIVRAFLWTSWQRCQMIYFHRAAADCLNSGSSDGKRAPLTIRGTLPSPGITIQEMSKQKASLQKAPNMCGWNFEVLRTNHTTCIPNDHQLRAESIAKINEVFLNAKVMLVCDRDIMEIDVSHMTTSICELLLTTAIVSDWNVRAWTFFEAFRARRTIHLLCRNETIVPLIDVMKLVHREGALEIGNLLLAVPHFLPPLDDSELGKSSSKSRRRFEEGYLPIELGGSLLSHRTASRPGDDIVIWSLLISEKTINYSAETFWKSMQGSVHQTDADTGRLYSSAAAIRTEFLVSSAPRLKVRGLRWAPATPGIFQSTNMSAEGFNGSDGGLDAGGADSGLITRDGLVADWQVFRFKGPMFWSTAMSLLSKTRPRTSECQCPVNLARIRNRYLRGYRWGAILCPLSEPNKSLETRWYHDGGKLRRTAVAICATNEVNGTIAEKYTIDMRVPTKIKWDYHEEVKGWEWRGTYLWDDSEPLPQLQKVKYFLIE